MAKTSGDSVIPRKKRAKQTGEMVATRVQPELLEQIDKWRREQPDLPTRPEAIRRLVLRGLEKR
jgi:hypothetical protein